MKVSRPFRYDFKLKIGDDFSEVITFTGSTITAWDFEGNAVAADGSTTTALTFVKATPLVTISISDTVTANFTAQNYEYKIIITRGSIKKTFFEGVIKVSE